MSTSSHGEPRRLVLLLANEAQAVSLREVVTQLSPWRDIVLWLAPCDTDDALVARAQPQGWGAQLLDVASEQELALLPGVLYVAREDEALAFEEMSVRPVSHASLGPLDTTLLHAAAIMAEALLVIVLSQRDMLDGLVEVALQGGRVVCAPEVVLPEGCHAIALDATALLPTDEEIIPALVPPSAEVEEAFRAVSDHIEQAFGLNLSHYKPALLHRRIRRRMEAVGYTEWDDYLALLDREPQELHALFDDLLIDVTSFFRDPEAFELVASLALPALFDKLGEDEPFRAWVAACAHGEEAYTVAMLLLEEAHRRGISPDRIKLFATDISPQAIRRATEGAYSAQVVEQIPEALRARYLTREDEHTWRVNQTLRRVVIFARHNMLKDPPFSMLHMATCRNFLIYLRPEAQQRVLTTLSYALRTDGVLLLGQSEHLSTQRHDFTRLDDRFKAFRKLASSPPLLPSRPQLLAPSPPTSRSPQPPRHLYQQAAYEALFDAYIPPGFFIDQDYHLVHVFGPASQLLHHPPGRVEYRLPNLLRGHLRHMVTTALYALRRAPDEAFEQGTLRLELGDEAADHMMSARALRAERDGPLYYVITFERLAAQPLAPTPIPMTLDPDALAQQRILDLEVELTQLRQQLQGAMEELGANNEELHSVNEEMLVSNEELQSTNEELYSVNEELVTINVEHQRKLEELTIAHSELLAMARLSGAALLWLDGRQRLRRSAGAIEGLLRTKGEELEQGRALAQLPLSLEGLDLVTLTRDAIAQGRELTQLAQSMSTQRVYLARAIPELSALEPGSGGALLALLDVTAWLQGHADVLKSADALMLGLAQVHPHDACCDYLSEGAAQLLGHTSAREALTQPRAWLTHLSEPARLERWLLEPSAPLRVKVFPPGAPPKRVELSAAWRGDALALRLEDVTAAHLQERELARVQREQENVLAGLEAVVEALPMALFVINDKMQLQLASANTVGITGLGLNQVQGRGLDELSWPEGYPIPSTEQLQAALRSQEPRHEILSTLVEDRLLTFERYLLPTRLHEQPALLVTIRDITARLPSRADLDPVQQGMRALAEAFPAPIAFLDMDERHQFANSHYQAWLGRAGSQLHETLASEVFVERDYQKLRSKLAVALSGKSIHFDFSLSEASSPTQGAPLHVYLMPRKDAVGQLVGVILMAQDPGLAGRQRVNRDHALEAQKMESLGRLAGGIAHDFNNLLAAMLSNAEMAMELTRGLPQARECLEDIQLVAQRARELCQQLLAYSGRGKFVIETIALPELVREMERLLRVTVPRWIDVSLMLDQPDCVVRVDVTQLRQVIINLLTNAVEAVGQEPGTIELIVTHQRITQEQADAYTRRLDVAPGDYVALIVQDSGPGIPSEILDRIFDPFFSTKVTGRGLGLSTVQGIIHSHQGLIELERSPAGGARICALLPLARTPLSPPPPALTRTEPHRAITSPSRHILLIDDEVMILRALERVLRRVGYSVTHCETPREGIALYTQQPDRFHMAILDLTMPEMMGHDVARALRRITPELPILFISGHVQRLADDIVTLDRRTRFLQKPWSREDLLQSLETLCDPPPEEQG